MIVLGEDREGLEAIFDSVEVAGRVFHPYSMLYNHGEIYLCRGMKMPVKELWPRTKNYS